MKLSPDEKLCLEELYLHHRVATDQLRRKPSVLSLITAAFNRMTRRDADPQELLRYMITRRKKCDWPKLGDKCRRFLPAATLLTDAQLVELEAVYVRLDICSDEYLFSKELEHQLVQGFARRTGKLMPGATLVAVVIAKRKRGEWVTLREEVERENRKAAETASTPAAFSDLDLVDKFYRNPKQQKRA